MTNHNHAFGRALRALRKASAQSQEDLGFASGLDRTYISLLELGHRSPTLDTMIALCLALNISILDLISAVKNNMDLPHGG